MFFGNSGTLSGHSEKFPDTNERSQNITKCFQTQWKISGQSGQVCWYSGKFPLCKVYRHPVKFPEILKNNLDAGKFPDTPERFRTIWKTFQTHLLFEKPEAHEDLEFGEVANK